MAFTFRRRSAVLTFGAAVLSVGAAASEGGHLSGSVVFEYSFSDWSACSDECGIGTQERSLECQVIITTSGKARIRKVDLAKCIARELDEPTEPLSKECFGTEPIEEFCSSCPAELGGCRACAAGFDLDADGSCKNRGIEVLLRLQTDAGGAPGYAWQKAWRGPRLDACMTALVENAANIAGSRVGVYAVEPAEEVVRARRLGAGGDAASHSSAMIFVAAAVPQGAMAKELRDRLAMRFGAALNELGPSTCPESLRLDSASVLLPGGRRADACYSGLSLGVWFIMTVSVIMLGFIVYFFLERRYRKRESIVLAHRAVAAAAGGICSSDGAGGAAPGGKAEAARDVQMQEVR
mmetsp:Transcript_16792/g.48780  ORF Transcript_16792/g.48780 Transcript_16792/m.48780 type:complete len:351 (+) Transcript_16792:65-1117(+)